MQASYKRLPTRQLQKVTLLYLLELKSWVLLSIVGPVNVEINIGLKNPVQI